MRVESAIVYIHSKGGDVWVNGTLCEVGKHRSVSISALRLMFFAQADVWVFCVPKDKSKFMAAICSVRPTNLHFDSIAKQDWTCIQEHLPKVRINVPAHLSNELSSQSIPEIVDLSRKQQFENALLSFEKEQLEDPQSTYRHRRYETIIGSRSDGGTGIVFDRVTGRFFYPPD